MSDPPPEVEIVATAEEIEVREDGKTYTRTTYTVKILSTGSSKQAA